MEYNFYLGDYTFQNLGNEASPAEGIYLLKLSEDGHLIGAPELVAKQPSPSYFYLSKDKKRLYSVAEPGPGENGRYYVYSIDEKTKALTLISEEVAPGRGLCHVNADPAEKNLIGICYEEATVQVYPLDSEGKLTPMFCLRHHTGSGPNLERQEKAHAHQAVYTPDGEYVVVCDLGMDTLMVYTQIESNGKLHRALGKNVALPEGCGPRHLIFAPNGQYAYVACELSSEVMILSYNKENGFALLGKVSTLSAEFQSRENYPAAIRMTKDGRFLYVSNRGEDSIVLFRVGENGMLSPVKTFSTRGWYPRDFVLTEDEKFLVAVNQLSDNMVVYQRDEKTGLLSLVEEQIIVQKPICLQEI